jgi:hypothetical protein
MKKIILVLAMLCIFASPALASSVNVTLSKPMGDVYAWNYPSQDTSRNGAGLTFYYYPNWMSLVYQMWNMTDIPVTGIFINNATMCMNHTYDSINSGTLLAFSRVYSNSWNETTLTWNNQPCGIPNIWGTDAPTDPSRCDVNPANIDNQNLPTGQYNCFDVTNVVRKDRLLGRGQNLSMVIWRIGDNANWAYNYYDDKEAYGGGDPPYMNITYTNCSDLGYLIPTGDDNVITSNTTICPDVYYINDTNNNGVFILNASNVSVDCSDSIFIGNNNGTLFNITATNGNSISNCDVRNYSFGIYENQTGQCYKCDIKNNAFTNSNVRLMPSGSSHDNNRFMNSNLTVYTGFYNNFTNSFFNYSYINDFTYGGGGLNDTYENITSLNAKTDQHWNQYEFPASGAINFDGHYFVLKNVYISGSDGNGLYSNYVSTSIGTWSNVTVVNNAGWGLFVSALQCTGAFNIWNSTFANNTAGFIGVDENWQCYTPFNLYNVSYSGGITLTTRDNINDYSLLIGNVTNSTGQPVVNATFVYTDVLGNVNTKTTGSDGLTSGSWVIGWVQNSSGIFYHNSPNFVAKSRPNYVKTYYTQNLTNYSVNRVNVQINDCLSPSNFTYVADENGTIPICAGTYVLNDSSFYWSYPFTPKGNGLIQSVANNTNFVCRGTQLIAVYRGDGCNAPMFNISANNVSVSNCYIANFSSNILYQSSANGGNVNNVTSLSMCEIVDFYGSNHNLTNSYIGKGVNIGGWSYHHYERVDAQGANISLYNVTGVNAQVKGAGFFSNVTFRDFVCGDDSSNTYTISGYGNGYSPTIINSLFDNVCSAIDVPHLGRAHINNTIFRNNHNYWVISYESTSGAEIWDSQFINNSLDFRFDYGAVNLYNTTYNTSTGGSFLYGGIINTYHYYSDNVNGCSGNISNATVNVTSPYGVNSTNKTDAIGNIGSRLVLAWQDADFYADHVDRRYNTLNVTVVPNNANFSSFTKRFNMTGKILDSNYLAFLVAPSISGLSAIPLSPAVGSPLYQFNATVSGIPSSCMGNVSLEFAGANYTATKSNENYFVAFDYLPQNIDGYSYKWVGSNVDGIGNATDYQLYAVSTETGYMMQGIGAGFGNFLDYLWNPLGIFLLFISFAVIFGAIVYYIGTYIQEQGSK